MISNSLLKATFSTAFLFTFQVNVFSQEITIGTTERLKEQLLVEIVPTLDLREGGMCFFYPQGKKFVTKVAINCSRLFDSVLEDITRDEINSSLFEPELYVRFKAIRNQRTLLEILQSDLQSFSEIRQLEDGFATEKLGLLTVEIAKISKYFLNQSSTEQSEIYPALLDLIDRYSEDVVLILLSFDAEESVSQMTDELWNVRKVDERSNIEDHLLIDLFLSIIRGTSATVIESATRFYDLVGNRSIEIVENYKSYVPAVALTNFNIATQVVNLLSSCSFSPNNTADVNCEQKLLKFGEGLEEKIAARYYADLNQWFSILPASEILSAFNPSDIKFKNLEISSKFIKEILEPKLKKISFKDEENLEKACNLLNEVPCTLNLQSGYKVISVRNIFLLLIVGMFVGVGFIFLKRRKFKLINELQTEKVADDLSANERSELRELRSYFNLKPFDKVNDLHKAYRKMVFAVHPDKLRDGGKEFVVLQSNYLKAKELLDKLESEREKKVSNG